ncbi:MAG TPA: hypothetical protein VMU36_09030 [Spirochaetia bacterium]|nr:hypothetical protein [Spirochaetia bacterium]
MKSRCLLCVQLLLTALLIAGCASAPAKSSSQDSLVVIKTDIINPDGLPLGRDFYLNYSGDYPSSRLGDNLGKYLTVVIRDGSAMTASIGTQTKAGFIGAKAEYPFVVPLPYERGTIVVADFVLIFAMTRASEHPNGFMSKIDVRKITNEEKEALMKVFRGDGAYAEWFTP